MAACDKRLHEMEPIQRWNKSIWAVFEHYDTTIYFKCGLFCENGRFEYEVNKMLGKIVY